MTDLTTPAIGANGRRRMRFEIVEAMRDLHELGHVSDDELRKVTIRTLGRDAVPKVAPLAPKEIAEVREQAGLSQAVLAGYFNVATNTVSQWERGERRPTGAALKLLHVVKRAGIEPLR